MLLFVWTLTFIAGPAFAETNAVPPPPIPDKLHARIETEVGDIVVELNLKEAPVTVGNFLRYVDHGFYAGGRFFRTVTLSNQPNNTVKIQVVQVESPPALEKDFYPPIPLERTRDTGLHHRDGTLSMARDGPDTAQSSFSI